MVTYNVDLVSLATGVMLGIILFLAVIAILRSRD
jgi:hypothetical protein